MPRKKTTETFIAEAKAIHLDKYDYSRTIYRGSGEKVCVICPKHGEFWVAPGNHLSRKSGCPICKNEKARARYLMSTEEFVEKAKSVHHNKYDYSLVDYQGTDKDVCILCHNEDDEGKEHGAFWQRPHNHLRGFGCPKCSGNHIPTTEEFVEKLRKLFGDKYDYSKVEYQSTNKKVCIICPKHGVFYSTPANLLNGHGCNKCAGNYGIDFNWFVKHGNEVHNGKYDYSEAVWKGYKHKLAIRCPEHGIFYQMPVAHLAGQGCIKCAGKYLDQELFIEKARKVHGDKYDYSKVVFKNSKKPVCIICPKHGEYWQTPNAHLLGAGCRRCSDENTSIRLTKSVTNFITLANEVHHNIYDYSQVQYVNRATPIEIICPKHGPFTQVPKNHLHGSGCPMCNNRVLEDTITTLLKRKNILFVREKTFQWLNHKGAMRLDFYLPEYNVAIECQGIQHFQAVDFWGGEESLQTTKERDIIKKHLCEQHGIQVLYFSNLGIRYPYKVIEDPDVLLHLIETRGVSDNPLWLPDPELPFE